MDQFVDTMGEWKLKTLEEPIDQSNFDKIKFLAEISNNEHMKVPLLEGVKHPGADPVDTLVKNIWRPTLTITGHEGFGDTSSGNVIHQQLTLK